MGYSEEENHSYIELCNNIEKVYGNTTHAMGKHLMELGYVKSSTLTQRVSELEAEREWRSVDVDPPDAIQGNKVLGFGNGYAFECEYDDDFWCNIGGETMTHWKALQPPKATSHD